MANCDVYLELRVGQFCISIRQFCDRAKPLHQECTVITLRECNDDTNLHPVCLSIEITYVLDVAKSGGVTHVTEQYEVTPSKVTVKSLISSNNVLQSVSVLFPAFRFDGEHNTTVTLTKQSSKLSVSMPAFSSNKGSCSLFQIEDNEKVIDWEESKTLYESRNGLMSEFRATITGTSSVTFSIATLGGTCTSE